MQSKWYAHQTNSKCTWDIGIGRLCKVLQRVFFAKLSTRVGVNELPVLKCLEFQMLLLRLSNQISF